MKCFKIVIELTNKMNNINIIHISCVNYEFICELKSSGDYYGGDVNSGEYSGFYGGDFHIHNARNNSDPEEMKLACVACTTYWIRPISARIFHAFIDSHPLPKDQYVVVGDQAESWIDDPLLAFLWEEKTTDYLSKYTFINYEKMNSSEFYIAFTRHE